MRGIATSLAIVALFIVVAWFVGSAAGFQFSLGSSLVLSVVLTLVLNVALRGFGSRSTRRRI